ncbi:MAG: efflux RND transporter permease subunit [Gammaproteobacteria bacterium]|nr:efflux RND transporter permease subunit [Gammaproteobacteria bacterium]
MIAYFIKHPTAANLLMLALIVLGLVSLPKLQRDTFPVIPATEIEIRLSYPGATPFEVEDAICYRAEDAMDSIAYLKELRCDARDNLAIISAEMEEKADITKFYNDIKGAIDGISTFPDKVEPASIEILERDAVVASVMITANTSDSDLKAYAEKVRRRLKQNRQIAQVKLYGFSEEDIVIEIPEQVQHRYQLGISDIKNILEQQSQDVPAGVVTTASGDFIVRFAGQKKKISEFNQILITSSKTGASIKLGDIAKIKKQFKTSEDKIYFNGHRAAQLEVSRNYNQDALKVMTALEQSLVKEREIAPKGVAIEISQNVTENIKDRLNILMENGLQGIILVIVSLWLFFSFRYSFWVSMGLPVSFLGAIFFMNLFGYTINMMTLVALLVAIGLLMDDAIVIAENIAAKMLENADSLTAVVEGTKQVFPGVLSSFLTTIMIVGPLAFMTGKMGAVLQYIPAVLVIVLSVSLIEAFLILPAHLYHSSQKKSIHHRNAFQQKFNQLFDSLRDKIFGSLIKKVSQQAYLTVGIIIALIIFSLSMLPAGVLKYRALPILESDVIQARVLLPQGTPLDETEAVVEKLVKALHQVDEKHTERQPGKQQLLRNTTVFYNKNVDAKESGAHIATISADLLRAESRNSSIRELILDWQNFTGQIPGVLALKFTDKERGIAGKAIDIRLMGTKQEVLKNASIDLQNWLSQFKGVLEVSDDLRAGKSEFVISLKDTADMHGVSAATLANELRSAVYGKTNLQVQSSGQTLDVILKLSKDEIKGLEDILYLPIPSKTGQLVPLSAVAEVTEKQLFSRVFRVHGMKVVTVEGSLDTEVANAKELMMITKKKFIPELKEKYPSVKVQFVGQGKESAETLSSLGQNIIIGLIGVFIILSFQFRSYVQPFVVLLAIPTGLIGVVWGHIAMGLELSMPSLVGLATLSGIVVNDSILLVSFIKAQIINGSSVIEAAQNAAKDRFRAVILTSLTTIIGLFPLLIETSTQAQLLIPLVASLAFGLLAATVMSLFLIPACFIILSDFVDFNKTIEAEH